MNKRYFVVGDIEMGKGDIMDDFSDDDHLVQFIDYINRVDPSSETFLILNGDIFDFLKMDYKGAYTRYITEEISLWKLEQVMDAHPSVFEALKSFIKNKNHYIYFVIGNHDIDLIWPALQEKLWVFFKERGRINFGESFDDEALHVEHGDSLDPFFKRNLGRLFLIYNDQRIINLPLGAYAFIEYLAPFKRKFPKEERFFPRGQVGEYYPEYKLEINKMFRRFAWKTLLIDPIFHFFDPTYTVPYFTILKHVLKFGLHFDDERFVKYQFEDLLDLYPEKEIFVLSHSHALSSFKYNKKHILVIDTWRNEYHVKSPEKMKKNKTYAEIYCEDGVFDAKVKIFDLGKSYDYTVLQKTEFFVSLEMEI